MGKYYSAIGCMCGGALIAAVLVGGAGPNTVLAAIVGVAFGGWVAWPR